MKKSLKIGLIVLIVLTILNTIAIIFIYSRANDAFDDLYKKTINSQAEIEKIKNTTQKITQNGYFFTPSFFESLQSDLANLLLLRKANLRSQDSFDSLNLESSYSILHAESSLNLILVSCLFVE